MVKAEFSFLGIDMKTNDFVMVLRRTDNKQQLPIWIGNAEAFSIAIALSGITPPRPLTHDLILDILNAFGAKLTAVIVTGLKEDTFYALLHVDKGDSETYVIDSRPSDAIALALRARSDIILSEDLQVFDLDIPTTDVEKELAERLRKMDPQEFVGL